MARTAMTTKQKLERVMNDFELFCLNFVKIVDNNGDLIPFRLNDQQKDFINNAGRFNQIVKPRQLGFTTISLAYCLWMAVRYPNTGYLIVDYKGDSAKDLFEKIKRMNKHLPRDKYKKLFPDTVRDNRDELYFSNGSLIRSTTAGNKELGRGMNLMYILLSEAAHYSDLDKILTSLEPALQKSEKARIVLESTAKGFNSFQRLYDKAKKGLSKYKAFFYPFFSSAYEKQFTYDIDQAVAWYKSVNKGKPLSKKDLDSEEQQLHKQGCSLRMLMWRQWTLQDKEKNVFYQEYPAFDTQAFISTGVSTFDQAQIMEQLHYVTSEVLPLSKEQVLADESFPEGLKPYITKGLYIFDYPKRGKRYYAGIDVASGNGQGDMSTITIIDNEGEQVASFYRNDVPVYKFTDIVRAIGLYFNYSFLCIENNGLGTALLERLRKQTDEPYLNLYKHKRFIKGQKKPVLGWTATADTIAEATTDFKEQFELGYINIKCKETLEQMQTYTEDNKRINGHHNDLVRSLMLSVQGRKQRKYYVEVV